MLAFKVFAGNMYCGVLQVKGTKHLFISRNHKLFHCGRPKIRKYKKLRLVRYR